MMNTYDYITITEHGYDRLKQRNGWNKKTANRMAQRVYRDGHRINDIKGYVRIWMKSKDQCEESEYVVYGENLYVFRENCLITSIHVPCRETVKSFCY